MAIITRWRMPPESSCGYCPRRRGTSVMRTCSSSARGARARALPAHAAMLHQRLRDLVADASDAASASVSGILEDHRHFAGRARAAPRTEQSRRRRAAHCP